MIAYLEQVDNRSHLDPGTPSELDTTYFVDLIEVLRVQATGWTIPLLILLSILVDISTAQIYSPSIGISKIGKEVGKLGQIRGPKTLMDMLMLRL